jgi:hypothetical protein
MGFIDANESPRNSQPHGPCLPGEATAVDSRLHIERAQRVGSNKGLLNVLDQRPARKVIT